LCVQFWNSVAAAAAAVGGVVSSWEELAYVKYDGHNLKVSHRRHIYTYNY